MAQAQKTFEAVPACEGRFTFSVSAAGRRVIEFPSQGRVEVVEIFLECVGANTFQFVVGGKAITPVYDLAARQSYSNAGFLLDGGDTLELVTGGANPVVGEIRWRPLDA